MVVPALWLLAAETFNENLAALIGKAEHPSHTIGTVICDISESYRNGA